MSQLISIHIYKNTGMILIGRDCVFFFFFLIYKDRMHIDK